MSEQLVVCWNGFSRNPPPIQELPPGIDVINLFLISIGTGSRSGTTLGHNYISTGGYNWQEILGQVKLAKQKHPWLRVCVTIVPPKRGMIWNLIPDPLQFARNVHELIVQWELDGIDLDTVQGQGVVPDRGFVDVVDALGAYFGPRATTGLRMSVVTYRFDLDADFLRNTKGAFDAVLLMGYFWNFGNMVEQFGNYASIVGDRLVHFGVSPTRTPVGDVIGLTKWNPAGPKGGMMELDINADAANGYAMYNAMISNWPCAAGDKRKRRATK